MRSVPRFFAVVALVSATLPLGAADCCPPPYTAEQCIGQCTATADCGGPFEVCDDGACIVTCDPENSERRECSAETPTCSSAGDLAGVCVCDDTSCEPGRACNATTGNCEDAGEGEGEG